MECRADMLSYAKLIFKQSKQGEGAPQLRTTELLLDAAENINNAAFTDEVSVTYFYQ